MEWLAQCFLEAYLHVAQPLLTLGANLRAKNCFGGGGDMVFTVMDGH